MPDELRQIYDNPWNVEPWVRDFMPSPSRAEAVGRARVRGEAVLSAGVAEDKYREGATPTVSGDGGRLEKIKSDREAALEKVGTVSVEFAQDGVEVFLKDKALGLTPLTKPLYLEPGVHSLVFKANEHRQMSRAFRIGAGERHVISAEFEALPVVEAPAETQKPEVAPQPAPAPVKETTKHNWVPAYVLGGVTVATLASSIVLRVVAGNKKEKVEELHNDLRPGDCADSGGVAECEELDSLAKSQLKFSTASDVTLIVGGVGVAATLGYVIYELVHRPRARESANSYKISPLAGFDGRAGWVSISGEF